MKGDCGTIPFIKTCPPPAPPLLPPPQTSQPMATTELPPPATSSSNPGPISSRSLASKKARRRSPWISRLIVLAILATTAGAAYQFRSLWFPSVEPYVSQWLPQWSSAERKLEGLITERVKRGPFQITVIERGTLDSKKNMVLTSKVEGSTTIISIKKEGE